MRAPGAHGPCPAASLFPTCLIGIIDLSSALVNAFFEFSPTFLDGLVGIVGKEDAPERISSFFPALVVG